MKRVDAIRAVAAKELADRLRNRWVWTVSALLLATTLSLTFLGATPIGVVGAPGPGAVMASLLNLAVYLVPLLALVMGAGVVIDEKRRGVLDLILVSPISSGEYFLGAFLGYALALSIALVTSFVPTGIALAFTTGIDPTEFARLLALVLALGTVFLALSFLISILSRDPARGVASSVLVWVLAVFVFDLAVVGLLVAYPGELPPLVFEGLLLLNPADIFRVLAFTWTGSAAAPLGLTGLTPTIPPAVLTLALVLWMIVPLLLGHRLFQRRLAMDTLI
ncbi:MAG: ABC transporter permease [bacterium]